MRLRILSQKNKIGFVYSSNEDLINKLKEKKIQYFVNARDFFIEKHIGILDRLYINIIEDKLAKV